MAETTVLKQIPSIPLAENGKPGFTVPQAIEELRKRVNDQWAQIVKDLNVLFASPGGGGGGTDIAPTNSPSPTGITLVANADGSMDVTLTWNYTQGTYPADIFIISWKEGTGPLAAPSSSDTAIAIPALARAFTFQGWDPNSNYRFGISAARKGINDGTYVAGTIVSPTSSPDWADVSVSGNYTGAVGGVAASTVVTNAANGATAFSDTTSFRSSGAPTNNPTPTGLTVSLNTDGSVDYTLDFAYTQGALPATGFFTFVKTGDGDPIYTDPHFGLGAQPSGTFTGRITLKGYPSDRLLSFGVAAYRLSADGTEVGAIVSSNAAPDWKGISSGSPNYTGTVWNLEQHNFVVSASGVSATDTDSKIQKDGADLLWSGRDVEFQGAGVNGAYGKSYNLTIYDLVARVVVYQHCFDLADFGAGTSTSADLFSPTVSGAGVASLKQAGKWGNAFSLVAPAGTDRAYLATGGSSTSYNALTWAECWVKRNGNPSQIGTLIAAGQTASSDTAYFVPILSVNTNGTVSAKAWTGSVFRTATSTAAVTDNNWHHVAAAVQGGDIHVWVDGVRTAGGFSGLTSFTMAPPGALFLTLGYSGSQQLVGTTFLDELIVATNGTLRATAANFTPPTVEASDWFGGASGVVGIWHFEEPHVSAPPCNSRVASKALGQVINSYAAYQGLTPGTNYLFVLTGTNNPAANRLNNGLPDVLASIGGRKALFTAGSFQTGAAYILVGGPGITEGNGYEAYAGQTTNDVNAHVTLTFQTQGENVVAGTGGGWDPIDIPGAPTNAPTAATASIVASSTGDDIITIGWSYTQPALSGNNRLADGFIVFVKSGDSSTPSVSSTASYTVGVDSRSFTMQSPYLQSWSFAVAAFRRTSSGVEVGTVVTSASGPDWQGIGGNSQVTNLGLGSNSVAGSNIQSGAVTDPKIVSLGATKITGLLTVNPSGASVTAIHITNAGRLRIDSINNTVPGGIDFEDPAGNIKAQILGTAAGLLYLKPGSHNNGIALRLGDAANAWTSLSGQAASQIDWTAPTININAGSGVIQTFGSRVVVNGDLGGCNPIVVSPAVPFSTYTIKRIIPLVDSSGNFVCFLTGIIP